MTPFHDVSQHNAKWRARLPNVKNLSINLLILAGIDTKGKYSYARLSIKLYCFPKPLDDNLKPSAIVTQSKKVKVIM